MPFSTCEPSLISHNLNCFFSRDLLLYQLSQWHVGPTHNAPISPDRLPPFDFKSFTQILRCIAHDPIVGIDLLDTVLIFKLATMPLQMLYIPSSCNIEPCTRYKFFDLIQIQIPCQNVIMWCPTFLWL